MLKMDVGRIQMWLSAGLWCCVVSIGCSESGAYMDYSELPAADSVSEKIQATPANAAASSPDGIPASTDQTNNQTTEAGVVPAKAVGSPEDSGNVTHAANSVTDDGTPSTTPPIVPPQPTLPDEDLTPVEAQYPELDENRKITLLVPEKRFRSEDNGKAIRVSYDDIDLLKVLNMHPVPTNAVDHFPDWLKKLDGQRIRIRGFMYPGFKSSGLTKFILTRDTGACCFGPDPLIYFLIPVKLADSETTDYIHMKPFDVEGIFRIDPEVEEGELFQLYRIENARLVD